MPVSLNVLYEDNHCLAVVKPAGMLTAGDITGDTTLLDLAREYLREKYHKPGNVFVGLVHRIDRPVSGVVLFARTSKAAGRLSEQFRAGRVRKVYHALVEGKVSPAEGELVDWLIKDGEKNIVRRVAGGTAGAKKSLLSYRTLRKSAEVTLLEVTPQTGRSHQIRVQLSTHGTPIYGDRKYGAVHGMQGAIALHAAELSFEHPVGKQIVTLKAPVPVTWKKLMG